MPEGGAAEPEGEHPFVGNITRRGGVIRATVRVALGDTAASSQPVDPAHWTLPEAEGAVDIPALRRFVPEVEPEPEIEPEIEPEPKPAPEEEDAP